MAAAQTSDLAYRLPLDVDERRNPEGAVGNCHSHKQYAGALAKIAPPSSGGHGIIIRAEPGYLRGYL